MKTRILFLFMTFCVAGMIHAQDTPVKNQKEKTHSSSTSDLIASKHFEFIPHVVFPTGMPPKDISADNYSIRFDEDEIISGMPYFGTARGGSLFGKDTGMRFRGKPEKFHSTTSNNKNNVTVKVKTSKDSFTLSLEVSESGLAVLTISSSNRQSISYQGELRNF